MSNMKSILYLLSRFYYRVNEIFSSITILVLCPISKNVFIVIQHYVDMVPFCVYNVANSKI
jgi:hypothetical protein